MYIVIPTTPERHERTKELLDSINKHIKSPHKILIYTNNDGGWVKAVYNAIEGLSGWVWLISSDCVVENDVLSILWHAAKDRPADCVYEPYNELHGDILCQHPFARVETIKKYLHPDFVHNCSDVLFTQLAIRDNKLFYVPEARIEHKHFVNGKAERDATYDVIFNDDTIKKDRETYDRLKKEYGL
jgi:hypothetical protein